MSFYSLFEPFIEAPTVRTTIQPVSGGIAVDYSTAQGTSFSNPNLRQTTLLPQINSGKTNFVVECLNFGITTTPVDETKPFDDRERITAEAYLRDPDQFGFPVFVGDYLPMDGAIEPLTIRDVATRETIEEPVSHRIRGSLMCGNEDNFDGADVKSSFISYYRNIDFVPFEDSSDTTANNLIVISGFIGDALADKIDPYDDSVLDTRFLTNNTSINAQLLLMTGSFDDDFRPLNSKSSTSGFIYSSQAGTDSLAFGGLLRA